MAYDVDPWGGRQVPARQRGGGLFPDLNRTMDDLFRTFAMMPGAGAEPELGLMPAMDIKETDKDFVIDMELPGVKEQDVNISVDNDVLSVTGQKSEEKNEEEKGGVRRQERRYGTFSRSIALPHGVNFDKAEAEYKNGVLTITLPKSKHFEDHVKKIPIKGESDGKKNQ